MKLNRKKVTFKTFYNIIFFFIEKKLTYNYISPNNKYTFFLYLNVYVEFNTLSIKFRYFNVVYFFSISVVHWFIYTIYYMYIQYFFYVWWLFSNRKETYNSMWVFEIFLMNFFVYLNMLQSIPNDKAMNFPREFFVLFKIVNNISS